MATKKLLFLIAIVFLGFLLRVSFLADFPSGFSADEVNQGYTAYSLLKTGKDEWGEFLPITPRSYGDYRAPLYTYLLIPFISMLGLTEFAVRLPNAVLGTLTILVVFYFVKSIFSKRVEIVLGGREIVLSSNFAYFAAFLFAINPWAISLSRGAFEPYLPVFLVLLGWLIFEKATKVKSNWLMVASMTVFGLTLFSYYSARFFVPIFIGILIIFRNPGGIKNFLTTRKIATVTLTFFLGIAIYTLFFGGTTRSADVAIFSPTDTWGSVADKRFEGILLGLPDEISRLFSNKVTYVVDTFVSQYLSYFSPQFLFTGGAGEATYGMISGRGLFYMAEAAFLVVGLFAFLLNKKSFSTSLQLLLAWLVLSPIPAALAKGPGYAANRAALMMVPLIIFSSLGAYVLTKMVAKFTSNRVALASLLVVMTISLVGFLEDYFFHAPVQNSRNMSYGIGEALAIARQIENGYDTIVVDKSISEPQMFVAFYNQVDPVKVQQASVNWLEYEKKGLKFVDQLGEYNLGKYVFKGVDYLTKGDGKTLYVVKAKEFPNAPDPIGRVNYPDGKSALLLFEL